MTVSINSSSISNWIHFSDARRDIQRNSMTKRRWLERKPAKKINFALAVAFTQWATFKVTPFEVFINRFSYSVRARVMKSRILSVRIMYISTMGKATPTDDVAENEAVHPPLYKISFAALWSDRFQWSDAFNRRSPVIFQWNSESDSARNLRICGQEMKNNDVWNLITRMYSQSTRAEFRMFENIKEKKS